MTYPYTGTELELFAEAVHWKRYALGRLRPYAKGDILEVGAGIGANLPYLINDRVNHWTCLEPDVALAARIFEKYKDDPRVDVASGGTVWSMTNRIYDVLFYVDVLEHIEHDREELARTETLLKPDGRLIVLAPAHPVLYSAFDKAIGHWRRYTRRLLLDIAPPGLLPERSFYLDSVGLLVSAANRLLLRQATPTLRQIRFWDRIVVPGSRVLDALLGRSLGKTVVVVWRKPNTAGSPP
jgi:SAM-dependent methyltransferase